MSILMYVVSFITGILAAMGLGGGMILILYMTIISDMPQITAQGVNLLFFIPIAALALIIHTKNKLVKWKEIIHAVLCGVVSAIGGAFIAKAVGNSFLTKIFAVFVLITGIKELLQKTKKDPSDS